MPDSTPTRFDGALLCWRPYWPSTADGRCQLAVWHRSASRLLLTWPGERSNDLLGSLSLIVREVRFPKGNPGR
jgi:hypothetical protein